MFHTAFCAEIVTGMVRFWQCLADASRAASAKAIAKIERSMLENDLFTFSKHPMTYISTL
jgi:hypothetical protein